MPPEEDPSPLPQRREKITRRAILLGLFGAAQACALQVVSKAVPKQAMFPYQSALTLLTGAVFWLFLLAILNSLLRRFAPRYTLTSSEFAVSYTLTSVGAAIGSQDHVMQIFPMFVFPFRAAQAEATKTFRGTIPSWLAPQDPAIVEPYYYGATNFWQPHLLKAWLVPLCVWMLWLGGLAVTMWAWNVILRRRWVDQDRLAFPCIQLPLEMCKAGGFGGLLSGKLFWGGFLVTTLIVSLDQIHARYPSIPAVPLGFIANPLLDAASPPWNALSPMTLTWDPIHLGVAYFIPMDILFSGWFFYLFRKVQEVFGYSMGWRDLGWDAAGFPFTRSQAAGAWVALFFLLVWAERHHLRRVFRSAFFSSEDLGDADEPGSYRTAARFLIGGTLFLVAFNVAAGMSLWLTLIFYGFFWALNVTMTRLYAQVGPPILELYYLDPQTTLTRALGTKGQSPASLTMFSLMYWYNRTDRGQPMAHILSGFKIADITRTDMRGIGRWVVPAFLLGSLVALLAGLHWAYRLGEDQWIEGGWRETFSVVAISRANEWINSPKGPQWKEIAFITLGGATTVALAKLSYTFIGFPFHPIGFAMAMCYTMEYNWPAYMGIWVLKGIALRYGGRSLYFRLAPFFLGLILGGLVTPPLWGFVAWVFEWYK